MAVLKIWILFFSVAFKGILASRRQSFADPMPDLIESKNSSRSGKPRIILPAMVAYTGPYGAGPIISEPIRVAIDFIHSSNILADYDVAVELIDTQCFMHQSLDVFIRQIAADEFNKNRSAYRLPILSGPLCEDAVTVGSVVRFYNWVGLASGTPSPLLVSKRNLFSQFNVMMPSIETFNDAICQFLHSMGWRKAHYLSDVQDYYTAYDRYVDKRCSELGINVDMSTKIIYINGGLGPSMEAVESAIEHLSKLNPRIVIFNTWWSLVMPCTLYRYGFHGPGYVFLQNGLLMYGPNTPFRFLSPGCTEEMIYKVLKSVIFFGHAPVMNTVKNPVNSLGFSLEQYEAKLRDLVSLDVQSHDYWFSFRTVFFDIAMVTALTLNETEQILKLRNESLLDYTVGSKNFRKKGPEFAQLLDSTMLRLNYSGLFARQTGEGFWNQRFGPTAFYQVQFEPRMDSTTDLTSLQRNKPIGTFNAKTGLMTMGPEPLKWPTKDNQPPLDSLKIVRIQKPMIKEATAATMISIAGMLVIADLGFLIEASKIRQNAFKKLNLAFLIGNSLLLMFPIAVLSASYSVPVHANCMAASICLVIGTSMIFSAITAKLYQARRMARPARNVYPSSRSSRLKSPRGIANSGLERSVPNNVEKTIENYENDTEKSKYQLNEKSAIAYQFAMTIVTLLLIIVWFAISPLQSKILALKFENSKEDISLAYQDFTYFCVLHPEKPIINNAFIGAIFMINALQFVAIIFFSISLGKIDRALNHEMGDVGIVRTSAYVLVLLITAGGVVTFAFFNKTPDELLCSVSGLSLIITATVLAFQGLSKYWNKV